jgi:hypothetical protein
MPPLLLPADQFSLWKRLAGTLQVGTLFAGVAMQTRTDALQFSERQPVILPQPRHALCA